MKELDRIDIAILKLLLNDGRRSFKDIAVECQTSKDIVGARYKSLEKEGIIVGATTQINPQKFGYYGMVMVMLNVDSQNINEVSERISKIPGIAPFRYYNSIYNIAAIARFKKLSDLENIKQMMNKQNKINQFQTYLWTDVRNIPENILEAPGEIRYPPAASFQEDNFSVDEIDEKIMKILESDGRLPFMKIAERLETSTSRVIRRYQDLKRDNLIKVSIQVNPHTLGFQNILEISLAVADQAEIGKMADEISDIPGVSYIVKISGNYDLSVVSLVKDCKEVVNINNKILEIPNIKRTEGTLRRLPLVWPGPCQHISTF